VTSWETKGRQKLLNTTYREGGAEKTKNEGEEHGGGGRNGFSLHHKKKTWIRARRKERHKSRAIKEEKNERSSEQRSQFQEEGPSGGQTARQRGYRG